MDGVGELFGIWLAIVSSRAAAPIALHPPAESGAIERAEGDLPRALPDELRALYHVADGQGSSWMPWTRPVHRPLFEDEYRFLSLDDALRERKRRLDAHAVQLDDGRAAPFPTDWFPFAADGDGNGLAVDLVTDDRGARGMVKRYRSTRWEATDLSPSLDSYLRRRIEVADFLSLYRESVDDPLRVHLRQWYHEQVDAPSAAVEESMEDALRYWLGFGWRDPGGIAAHYHWVVAWHMDERVVCDIDSKAASEGLRLANAWLLDRGMITESRHEQVEAIRLDEDGARASLLSQGVRTTSGRGEDCRYAYRRAAG